jgi:hypothetical protein
MRLWRRVSPRKTRHSSGSATSTGPGRDSLDQDGVIAIPKAQRPESQQSNLDALKIRLDDEDRAAITAPPKDRRYVTPPSTVTRMRRRPPSWRGTLWGSYSPASSCRPGSPFHLGTILQYKDNPTGGAVACWHIYEVLCFVRPEEG